MITVTGHPLFIYISMVELRLLAYNVMGTPWCLDTILSLNHWMNTISLQYVKLVNLFHIQSTFPVMHEKEYKIL